jgi:hypothetical protein
MINTSKLLKYETIERELQNDSPWVYAEVGSSVVRLDGEFNLEEIKNIYEWLKRNNKKKSYFSL